MKFKRGGKKNKNKPGIKVKPNNRDKNKIVRKKKKLSVNSKVFILNKRRLYLIKLINFIIILSFYSPGNTRENILKYTERNFLLNLIIKIKYFVNLL